MFHVPGFIDGVGGGGGRGVERTNEQTRPQKEKKKTAIAKPLQDDK